MPRDLRPINHTPLSESEEFQLKRLLDRSGQSLAEAERRRAEERAQEARLQARRDKLAAQEAKLSKRLAALRIDIDTATAALYQNAESGVAFRHVAGKLQEFGERVPSLSFFNTPADNLDHSQLLLLGELALEMYQDRARPKGQRSLRERMEAVKIDVGQDVVGGGGPPDNRSALAQAIVNAGRKRRGETS